MKCLHKIRRVGSALMALALLWTAVLPTAALALNGPPGTANTWVEVCTSRGTLMVKLPQAPHDTDQGSKSLGEPAQPLAADNSHCPYCHWPSPDGVLASHLNGVTKPSVADAPTTGNASNPSALPLRWVIPPANAPPV